jgi:hypothetical protein
MRSSVEQRPTVINTEGSGVPSNGKLVYHSKSESEDRHMNSLNYMWLQEKL